MDKKHTAMTDPLNFTENEAFWVPLSEIFMVGGAAMFLLGFLYLQLPVDLIPDFIPCIGKYDNMLASFFSFIGLILCALTIYFQLYYLQSPNCTVSWLIASIQEFIDSDDTQKWDKAYVHLKDGIETVSNQTQETLKPIIETGKEFIENKTNELRQEL